MSGADAASGFGLLQRPALSRGGVDRSEPLRVATARQLALWPTARVLLLDRANRTPVSGDELALRPATELGSRPPEHAVLLGEADGVAYWAVRVADADDSHERHSRAHLAHEGAARAPAGPAPDWTDLRSTGAELPDIDAGLLTTAVAVLNWHDRAGFCAVCGNPTRPRSAGWARVCTACDHEEYPRTDPAVICLVHDHEDEHVLLARQPGWPAGRFTVLAGFVEAGESAEACVRREIAEEVGVTAGQVRYLDSQPWPFPRSLMLGFRAVADRAEPLRPADGEIAQARWVPRTELCRALERGGWTDPRGAAPADEPALLLPGRVSIARRMLEGWAHGHG